MKHESLKRGVGGRGRRGVPGRGAWRAGWGVFLALTWWAPTVSRGQDCGGWGEAPFAPLSERRDHAMVYDARRGVTVLFGGFAGYSQVRGDTWEWDGTTWTRVAQNGPSPRFGHAMAYDVKRGVTVLFGGGNDKTYFNGLWEWDGPGVIRKARCRQTGQTRELGVLLVGGVSGDAYDVELSSGERRSGMLNRRERAKVVFADRPEGASGQVTVTFGCETTDAADYACP